MHFDTFSDFFPPIFIILTLWIMRARFTSPIDSSWPLVYYFFLVLFVRSNEDNFNNTIVFVGILCALFMRYEFMAGFVLKVFRTGELLSHIYVIIICFMMFTRP
jgi:predicted membrane protein